MEKQRIDWVDFAKGICIIAVVTFYATSHVEGSMHARGWMHALVSFAQPFRMPDFFLLSGLFVSHVINRPIRAYLDSKVIHFLYFYVLWVTLRMLLQDGATLFGPHPMKALGPYLELYIQPHGQLWFIYFLPLFFIAVRLLHSIPAGFVLMLAIALKLADLNTGWKIIDRFSTYFLFFYSGYALSPYVFRMIDWTRHNVKAALAILGIWFFVNLSLVLLHWTYLPGMQMLTGYAGAAAVMMLSGLLSALPWMQWLRYLGRHSIVIYLAFVVPLAAMRKILLERQLISDVGTATLLVIVASVGGAIMLFWGVRNTPMRFLFARPAWISLHRKSDTPSEPPSDAPRTVNSPG